MVKYLAIIHYKAQWNFRGFKKIDLVSTDLVSAMNEAEKYIDEDVYQIRIAEKNGKECTATKYIEILTNRKKGWHATDEKHCEIAHTWIRYQDRKKQICATYELMG